MADRTQARRARSQRNGSAKRAELEAERDATSLRLERLQAERQSYEAAMRQNEAAQHQMIGRLRYVQEQLGEAPPMADPPEPEEAVELEDAQA